VSSANNLLNDIRFSPGVNLSQNAKWNEHLENMITNITKHLGILQKLKFSLKRSNLEKMYLVYIRPLFEYACEVWDNCGIRVYSSTLNSWGN
jgi:hypothetical protein